MSQAFGDVLPWPGKRKAPPSGAAEQAAETTPGSREETPWVTVAANLGPSEAAIIKGRLESEEIPAIVQQESAGIVFGLTVGPMGFARVLVPEPLAEQALAILEETFEPGEDLEDDE
ncbi:MAG: putative signal transducing protein [Anaerolineae bacterium]